MNETHSFYTENELKSLGLKKIGNNVKISRKSSFYSSEKISLGNEVRIDDFCILSGEITIGSYVHISAYTALYGSYGIKIDDFCGLSPRVIVFSAIDDFSGDFMIGPMIPSNFINIIGGEVLIEKFVQIGAGSIVLPNVQLNEGAVVGAMSLVNKDVREWSINAGIPSRYLKYRSKKLVGFANQILILSH